MGISQSFSHELIIPDEGFPFKLFVFEGKDGNYFRDKHWHRSIEIFMLFEGKVTCYVNEKAYDLKPGEFVIVNSNEPHAVSTPDKNYALVMQISRDHFEKYYSGEEFIWFSHEASRSDELIADILMEMQSDLSKKEYGYELIVISNFYKLLHLLVSRYRKASVSPELIQANRNLAHLSRITSYIKKNYAASISLESLATMFSYSPTYISHMFRKYANTTYKAYIQNLRLEHAYPDLVHSTLSVGEIALKHGFVGSRAFSAAFQKAYGILPSEFRKNVSEND